MSESIPGTLGGIIEDLEKLADLCRGDAHGFIAADLDELVLKHKRAQYEVISYYEGESVVNWRGDEDQYEPLFISEASGEAGEAECESWIEEQVRG